MQGLCSLKGGIVPMQTHWGDRRKFYHDIVTTKSCWVKYLWSPIGRRPPPLVWMHELCQQCNPRNLSALPVKSWANGFLPKCLLCGALAVGFQAHWFQDLRLMLSSDMSHSSSKLLLDIPLYSLIVSVVVYTTEAPPSGSHTETLYVQ